MKRIDKAHAVFLKKLQQDFCDTITGKAIDMLDDGDHPQKHFLVGMLSPSQDQENALDSSSVTVSQLGIDLLFSEDDLEHTFIDVRLSGDIFYRVRPSLEQQRRAFAQEAFDKKIISSADFSALSECQASTRDGMKLPILAVYRKVSLETIIDRPLSICIGDCYSQTDGSGELPAEHETAQYIRSCLKKARDEISALPETYKKTSERVEYADLISETAWAAFVQRAFESKDPFRPNWDIGLLCYTKKLSENLVRASIRIANFSPFVNVKPSGKNRSDVERVNDLYNAGLTISLASGTVYPLTMDYFRDDYKYDRKQYAIGSNCAVEVSNDKRLFSTTLMPNYEQKRLKTVDNPAVTFAALDANCISILTKAYNAMLREKSAWENDFQQRKAAGVLTSKGIDEFTREIEGFSCEIMRFKSGIDLIEKSPMTRQAFQLMNRTFRDSPKAYTSWRLFQIVFIVSLIPDIVACDPDDDIMNPAERGKTKIGSVDLLYFPTGGGKTEAFLGVMVFNLFFDRLRGKNAGVTALLKYPLRLLSVQQVQRVADILAIAERYRKQLPDQENADPFAIGYFVGDGNTPNKLDDKAIETLRKEANLLDEKYRVIDRCPFCRNETVHVEFDEATRRLIHRCKHPGCESGGVLPVMIVDTDIYRYLPSVVISTLDKIAGIGMQRRFRHLFGNVASKCPIHGFQPSQFCEETGCTCQTEEVTLYDPAPTLCIQDELHLVRESLGTFDSHFETLLQYYSKNLSPSKRGIKVIGATATISSYREQVNHLYRMNAIRFPCASPYVDRNFYAKEDRDDLHRLIMGFIPFGRAIINSVVYALKAMRLCVWHYMQNPSEVLAIEGIDLQSEAEAVAVVRDYWIMLEYNNVKVDANNVINALYDPINTELNEHEETQKAAFEERKMTGDDTFQDVRQTLAEVETRSDVENGPNIIVATSMISHGVDADRFGNIFFFGIPNNTAEYIQAYSRVGRRYAGLVVDIVRPTRERELSYFRNFVKSHEYKDILIDPVPLNRWASKAISCTLPGVFSALMLNYYDFELRKKCPKVYLMSGLQSAIQRGYVPREEVKEHIRRIYGCTSDRGHGAIYRNRIDAMVDKIFDDIENSVFDKRTPVSSGLSQLGYEVMSSLRNTDATLDIELR